MSFLFFIFYVYFLFKEILNSLYSRVAEWHHALSSMGVTVDSSRFVVINQHQEGAKPPMKNPRL